MRRTSTFVAAAALVLGVGAAGQGCLSPNELVLVINTSMQPGEDIDQLRIVVNGEETPYVLDPQKDGSIQLPATLGFLPPGGSSSEPFTIQVDAYKGAEKRVSVGPFSLRIEDIGPTFFPVDIPFLCADDACAPGETCKDGLCISPDCGDETCEAGESCVDGACAVVTLPGQEYPEEGLFAEEVCLDVLGCLGGGQYTEIDPSTCSIPAPSGADMNVALLTAPIGLGERGAGVCNSNVCFLPLDDLPSPQDGRLQLPPGVCVQIIKGRVLGVAAAPATEACPSKRFSTVINRPGSSVASCASASQGELSQPWIVAGQVNKTRIKHTETTIVYPGGDYQVLVAGGFQRTDPADASTLTALASVEVLVSPGTPWIEKSEMRFSRAGHTATLISENGIVLVAGGLGDQSTPIASTDIFRTGTSLSDPTQGWELAANTPSMVVGRYGHSATLLPANRTVLLTGGLEGDDSVTSTVEVFDADTGAFSQNPPVMSTPRVGHTATPLLDGRILIVGGAAQKDNDGFNTFVEEVQVYDAELGGPGVPGFDDLPPLSPGRMLHAAVRLENGANKGLVLVIGGGTGEPGEGLTPLGDVHFFDPALESWACAPRGMNVPRFGHTATELADGRVLVVGGVTSLGTSAPAEIFEPGSSVDQGTWTLLSAPKGVPRVGHTATLLPPDAGGARSVLLVGGGTIDPAELTPSVDLGAFEKLLLGVDATPVFTFDEDIDVVPPTPGTGCGDGGGGAGGGQGAPAAPDPITFAGNGFAADPALDRDGCSLSPSSDARRSSRRGAPWALLALLLAARRRRSARAE